jgi:hypothetical protein
MTFSNWPYTPPQSKDKSNDDPQTKRKVLPSTTQAIIFGLGSMFNHSTLQQNVGWERDLENKLITYVALRDIKEGEELCISYGQRLTFKDTDEEDNQDIERDPDDWTEVLNYMDLID